MLPNPLSDLDRLGLELFWTFARVECALKTAGFLKDPKGPAEADWEAFARTIVGLLENDPPLRPAVAYMRLRPPMKQVAQNGQLAFVAAGVNRNLTFELIACLKRVRNNLFHGGKFNRDWFDAVRSEELIRHSLSILEACMRVSPRLRNAFDV